MNHDLRKNVWAVHKEDNGTKCVARLVVYEQVKVEHQSLRNLFELVDITEWKWEST